MMGVPDVITAKMLTRKNWPEQGSYGFIIIPFDIPNNTPLENLGPMRISSGVIMPHPTDPNMAIMTKLDKMSMKFVPDFALKMMLGKKLIPNMYKMINDFKQ